MLFNYSPGELIELAVAALRVRREYRRKRHQALADFRSSLLREAITQLELDLPFTAKSEDRKMRQVCLEVSGWSEAQIVALCDAMVTNAMEVLRDARSDESRKEVLQWMAPAAKADAPFSFEMSCRVAGLEPDALRHYVKKHYRSLIERFVAAEDPSEVRQPISISMPPAVIDRQLSLIL